MNQVEKAICEVLKTILERDIVTLEDFKTEYLKELILFINFDFFENEEIQSWEQVTDCLERYLQFQKLDQKLDFNLDELEQKDITGMISAFIQIFAIMAIFKPKEWENIINFVNYQEKKLIFEILNPILYTISQELKKFRKSSSFEDGISLPKNKELKLAMQNMEIKEKTLILKQQEIDKLQNRLAKIENENQKILSVLENKDKEIKELQTLKDEALRQLDEQISFTFSKEDFVLNQRKVQQQREKIRELRHALDFKNNEINDKNIMIQQLQINEQIYLKNKQEFDELASLTSYYKEQIQSLKQKNEIQKSKLKIQNKKIQQLELIQQEHKKCDDMKNQFQSKIQGLQHECKILNKKFENEQNQKNWFKQNSIKNLEQNSANEKLVNELEQENYEIKAQIQTMMDLCNEESQIIQVSQSPLSLQNLEISEIKNSFIIRRTTKKRQEDLLSVENKRFSKFNKKENQKLLEFQILQQKKTPQKSFLKNSNQEEVCQMFYTVCMQAMQLQSCELKKSFYVPNKENRNRDIFQRFTLKNILNKRQLILYIMETKNIYKKIDHYERKILEKVGIKRSLYHKGNVDNFGIHYLDFSREKKIPILIIHGYGATGITNYKLLPYLIKSFRVILVDLPGFGKSYRPDINFKDFDNTISFFTVPLVSLVNYLKLEKFIIICHSYGSLISAHFAAMVKERILAIFFVGAAGFTDKAFTKNETEVLVEDFSKKWKLGNTKMVEMARYWIFEKKLPIFNYMSKGMRKTYVQNYFLSQDLQMDFVEKNLIIEYFYYINEFPPCGENSLWFLVKFGGYSKSPIINIIKNNRELQAYVYYGDQDYLDFKHAQESCKKNHIAKNFHILPNTKHHVFLHNPEAFLKQFFIDMQQVYRENNLQIIEIYFLILLLQLYVFFCQRQNRFFNQRQRKLIQFLYKLNQFIIMKQVLLLCLFIFGAMSSDFQGMQQVQLLLNEKIQELKMKSQNKNVAQKIFDKKQKVDKENDYDLCLAQLEKTLDSTVDLVKEILHKDVYQIISEALKVSANIVDTVDCFVHPPKLLLQDRKQCYLDHLEKFYLVMKQMVRDIIEKKLDKASVDLQKGLEILSDMIRNC